MPDAFTTQLLDLVKWTDYIATFADPGRKILDIEPFSYSVDGDAGVSITNSVLDGTFSTFLTPMAGDSDFVMTYLAGFARAVGSTLLLVNPALMVQITDTSSAKTFFQGASPMAMVAGQGGFPFLLTSPRVIRARSTLKLDARVAVGPKATQQATFNGFYFTYHGAKIWYG